MKYRFLAAQGNHAIVWCKAPPAYVHVRCKAPKVPFEALWRRFSTLCALKIQTLAKLINVFLILDPRSEFFGIWPCVQPIEDQKSMYFLFGGYMLIKSKEYYYLSSWFLPRISLDLREKVESVSAPENIVHFFDIALFLCFFSNSMFVANRVWWFIQSMIWNYYYDNWNYCYNQWNYDLSETNAGFLWWRSIKGYRKLRIP